MWYVATERQRKLRIDSVRSEEAWATSSTHCWGVSAGSFTFTQPLQWRAWRVVYGRKLLFPGWNPSPSMDPSPFFALFSECLVRVSFKDRVNSTCRIKEGFMQTQSCWGYFNFECGVVHLISWFYAIRPFEMSGSKTTYFVPLNTIHFISKQHLQHWQNCVKFKIITHFWRPQTSVPFRTLYLSLRAIHFT